MKLSIIVPVYNVEHYLKTCLDSLFNQDLSTNQYEVITVNDGSTDGSLRVLESLKNEYPSINIINQNNQGLSGARNTGIAHALGKYLLFVDSDDYILENTLTSILQIAENNKLDILEFAAAGITETKEQVYLSTNSTNGKVITGEEYLASINYMSSACNKLYSREFLNTHKLRFMPGVYIEDIEFNTRAVYKAQRMQAINTVVAHFLQREGSITRTKNWDKSKKMIYDIHTVLSSINNFNEAVITSNSKAFIPIKQRTCALVTTMLLRVLTEIKDYRIKKDIFNKLKQQNLYPIPYKTGDKRKNQFRRFANHNLLFSIICKMYCLKNNLYDQQ